MKTFRPWISSLSVNQKQITNGQAGRESMKAVSLNTLPTRTIIETFNEKPKSIDTIAGHG